MKTRVLRWTVGVTCHEHIWSEDIRDRYEVEPIVENCEREIFDRYGHVFQTNENSLAKIGKPVETTLA